MEQRTEEWYKSRLGKFSGSGISAIMASVKLKRAENTTKTESVKDFLRENGVSEDEMSGLKLAELKEMANKYPEKMIWELSDGALTYIASKISEQLTGIQLETPLTFDMERGIDLEPIAIKEWLDYRPNISGGTPGFMAYNDDCGGSPDFIGDEDDDSGMMVVGAEFKCPNQHNHAKNVIRVNSPKEVLKYHKDYFWQVIFYMLLCNAERWYWVSYHPDFPTKNIHDVLFDINDEFVSSSLKQLEFALANAVEEKNKMMELFV